MASIKMGVSPTNPKQQAAIPFFGHTEILHMGSTAPAAAVVMISKWQLLASSTIVRYTLHDEEIYSEKDKLLGLGRLRAIVNFLQAKSTKTCVKQQNVMT